MATQYKFANIDELNYGISNLELDAAEGLASYVSANRFKENFFKSLEDFAQIIGLKLDCEENIDAVNYAINVCKRLFPHHLRITN